MNKVHFNNIKKRESFLMMNENENEIIKAETLFYYDDEDWRFL